MHATARRSVRLHGAPTSPRPQPTTYALRREGNLRRTPLWRGRIASAARAPPSRRARPSAAPAATLPLLSHCSSPRLHTDSPQTILSGARTRHFRSNCSCALRRWPTHHQRPVVALRSNECGWPHATPFCDLTPDQSDECRPCGQSAGRAVSVPLGFGVNTTDPRSTPIVGIRTTDTALTKAGVAGEGGEKRHDKFARSTADADRPTWLRPRLPSYRANPDPTDFLTKT